MSNPALLFSLHTQLHMQGLVNLCDFSSRVEILDPAFATDSSIVAVGGRSSTLCFFYELGLVYTDIR